MASASPPPSPLRGEMFSVFSLTAPGTAPDPLRQPPLAMNSLQSLLMCSMDLEVLCTAAGPSLSNNWDAFFKSGSNLGEMLASWCCCVLATMFSNILRAWWQHLARMQSAMVIGLRGSRTSPSNSSRLKILLSNERILSTEIIRIKKKIYFHKMKQIKRRQLRRHFNGIWHQFLNIEINARTVQWRRCLLLRFRVGRSEIILDDRLGIFHESRENHLQAFDEILDVTISWERIERFTVEARLAPIKKSLRTFR